MFVKEKLHYDTDACWNVEQEPQFYLDHSCDEWIIGGIEEAKLFVSELQDLIAKAEKESN